MSEHDNTLASRLDSAWVDEDRLKITPRRIDWETSFGWVVRLDEDGISIRTPKGDAIEYSEVAELVRVLSVADDALTVDQYAPIPASPSREQYTLAIARNLALDALKGATAEVRDTFGGV